MISQRKFKHKATGNKVIQLIHGGDYVLESQANIKPLPDFVIAPWIVESGFDWEEIINDNILPDITAVFGDPALNAVIYLCTDPDDYDSRYLGWVRKMIKQGCTRVHSIRVLNVDTSTPKIASFNIWKVGDKTFQGEIVDFEWDGQWLAFIKDKPGLFLMKVMNSVEPACRMKTGFNRYERVNMYNGERFWHVRFTAQIVEHIIGEDEREFDLANDLDRCFSTKEGAEKFYDETEPIYPAKVLKDVIDMIVSIMRQETLTTTGHIIKIHEKLKQQYAKPAQTICNKQPQ